ncbi:DNA-binding protein HU-beta [Klebsiella pneumoniae]|uniref:DNA-binding protein HU-beta n=1 Tax=Klebsiella pneumoniae TaxID=573 RepID=A0A2X3DDN4_KLEPN|nr:DNA-binding protein HU-beta [Klebsiella pneumoniae]
MNKSQLIDKIAAGADISKAAAGRALDALIASVTESLQAGDDVALVGLVPLLLKNVPPVLVATRKQVKKLLSLPQKCRASVLVKR